MLARMGKSEAEAVCKLNCLVLVASTQVCAEVAIIILVRSAVLLLQL